MRALAAVIGTVAVVLSPAGTANEYDFATPEEALALLSGIRQALAADIEGGTVQVELSLDRIRVRIGQLVQRDGVELSLNPDRDGTLERLVSALGDAEEWSIEIQGHCSTAPLSEAMETVHGTHERYTEAQAAVVRDAMVALMREQLNRDAVLISIEGKGGEHPVASNTTAEGQRQNDRTEILISPPVWPDMPRPVFPGEPQTD